MPIFIKLGTVNSMLQKIFTRSGEETWQIRIIFYTPPPPLTALIFTKLADAYCQVIFVGASVTEFCTLRIEKFDGQNTGIAVLTVEPAIGVRLETIY